MNSNDQIEFVLYDPLANEIRAALYVRELVQNGFVLASSSDLWHMLVPEVKAA